MTMPAARFVRVHLGRASAVCLIMSLSGALNARGDGVAYVSQQRSVEASVLDVNSGFFEDSLTSPGFSLFNVFLEVTPPSPTVVGRSTPQIWLNSLADGGPAEPGTLRRHVLSPPGGVN